MYGPRYDPYSPCSISMFQDRSFPSVGSFSRTNYLIRTLMSTPLMYDSGLCDSSVSRMSGSQSETGHSWGSGVWVGHCPKSQTVTPRGTYVRAEKIG